MIIPLMPFYAKEFGASGLVVGLLVSSFAVAQLVSAPMWGRFSDRYGRRPALHGRPRRVGDRVRHLRLRRLAVAAVPVAPRAGRRRRNGERHPGIRRRRAQARGAREGTGLAVGGDERRRRARAGAWLVRHRRLDHMRRAWLPRRCACSTWLRVALSRRVARHGRGARDQASSRPVARGGAARHHALERACAAADLDLRDRRLARSRE